MQDTKFSDRHIGHRLQDEMKARDMSPADVAVLFGVKPPSVYDWINFGRIAKKHLPRLVEVFGRSVNWWLTEKEMPDTERPSMSLGLVRLAKVLEGKSDEEIDRIADALELLLSPPKTKPSTMPHHYRFHDPIPASPAGSKKSKASH